jgi:3-hydroxyacyl-[acyl-carrier-protein] dehydratase
VKNEIERHMTVVAGSDGVSTSRFVFPPDFIGFQGHFPANKVLPGACQIQCALSTIEKNRRTAVALKEIVLAKYLAPVHPDEEVTCAVREVSEEGGVITCKASIMKGGSKAAELKLKVSLKGGRKPRFSC